MKRFDAIAIVSTGIVSSLLTLSLRVAPAFGKVESSISNVPQERTLPLQNNSKFQPVVFTADVSSENVGNQISDNTTILGLAAIGAGSAGLIWSLKLRNKTLSAQYGSRRKDVSIEKANPRLRKELLRLVGGDSRTANRLVAGIKQSHPGKSINWVVEKVIYDLERDR
ncbi:hypothetical protein Riv7116_0992 [Rivularia sp. PCC 7116]|uniref:hypothetical protein n=1 Tax=Rivularia sp. PCC 7116 TaxID=373994 RepID=UPI00029ECF67|nr:hypothetical protein [Rivularia sp. PCC 7116]AFY53567.1 hypothetical protein Riv7116_0992 [Rivularia sp. PCC 7116]